MYIPDEYVLTGLSINCCNSENSIISSSLSSISFLVRPNIAALVYMFSLPLMSGWNPAPSSRRLETLPHISIEPLSGYIILVNNLSVVLLPQPFLPIRPTASPFFTVKLILLRTTIIIVSHALGQIEEICDKSIWIKDGQIEQEGDPREVDIAYLDYMNQERLSKDEQERARILRIEAEQRRLKKAEEENKEGGNDKRYGSFEARINDVILSCDDGKRTETLETGRKAVIEIDYSVETPVKDVHARYMIYRIDGQLCSGSSTKIDRLDAFDLDKDGKIVIEFDSMTLTRSQYWVDIVLEKADGTPIDYYKEAVRFNVVSGIEDKGVARIEHTWKNC